MKTIEVKTNIMCGSCIAKVTPVLNETVGENNWKVDTANPKKVLSVTTENLMKQILLRQSRKQVTKPRNLHNKQCQAGNRVNDKE